jgi:nitroreductase
MWDFFETIRHRHSVREYQSDMPVEPDKLHAVLESACAAPSAGDLQSYRIVVVGDPQLRQSLGEAAKQQDFLAKAPLCLAFCADSARARAQYGERGADLYAVQDATIAAAYAQLACVAAGLATTWVGYFDESRVRAILDLEPEVRAIALLTVGYAAEIPKDTPRRPMTEVVSYL